MSQVYDDHIATQLCRLLDPTSPSDQSDLMINIHKKIVKLMTVSLKFIDYYLLIFPNGSSKHCDFVFFKSRILLPVVKKFLNSNALIKEKINVKSVVVDNVHTVIHFLLALNFILKKLIIRNVPLYSALLKEKVLSNQQYLVVEDLLYNFKGLQILLNHNNSNDDQNIGFYLKLIDSNIEKFTKDFLQLRPIKGYMIEKFTFENSKSNYYEFLKTAADQYNSSSYMQDQYKLLNPNISNTRLQHFIKEASNFKNNEFELFYKLKSPMDYDYSISNMRENDFDFKVLKEYPGYEKTGGFDQLFIFLLTSSSFKYERFLRVIGEALADCAEVDPSFSKLDEEMQNLRRKFKDCFKYIKFTDAATINFLDVTKELLKCLAEFNYLNGKLVVIILTALTKNSTDPVDTLKFLKIVVNNEEEIDWFQKSTYHNNICHRIDNMLLNRFQINLYSFLKVLIDFELVVAYLFVGTFIHNNNDLNFLEVVEMFKVESDGELSKLLNKGVDKLLVCNPDLTPPPPLLHKMYMTFSENSNVLHKFSEISDKDCDWKSFEEFFDEEVSKKFTDSLEREPVGDVNSLSQVSNHKLLGVLYSHLSEKNFLYNL